MEDLREVRSTKIRREIIGNKEYDGDLSPQFFANNWPIVLCVWHPCLNTIATGR